MRQQGRRREEQEDVITQRASTKSGLQVLDFSPTLLPLSIDFPWTGSLILIATRARKPKWRRSRVRVHPAEQLSKTVSSVQAALCSVNGQIFIKHSRVFFFFFFLIVLIAERRQRTLMKNCSRKDP